MTGTTPTVEGFIEFINEQPPEREIDHSYGWSQCAVGDYVDSINGLPREQGALNYIVPGVSGFIDTLAEERNELYREVSGHKAYGSLQKWIKDNLPEGN